jgi:AcrR family transcriptional regulator
MPIDIDEAQRLKEIAQATFSVARREGARAVTIRAVAKELGGSTTMITNYVPNRAALMINAVRAHQDYWHDDLEQHVAGRTGEDRLRAAADWNCTTDEFDRVLRQLWVEMLATANGGEAEAIHEIARDERRQLLDAVLLAAPPGLDVDTVTDILFLMIRGYLVSTLEDPDSWPTDRGSKALQLALDLIIKDPGLRP